MVLNVWKFSGRMLAIMHTALDLAPGTGKQIKPNKQKPCPGQSVFHILDYS